MQYVNDGAIDPQLLSVVPQSTDMLQDSDTSPPTSEHQTSRPESPSSDNAPTARIRNRPSMKNLVHGLVEGAMRGPKKWGASILVWLFLEPSTDACFRCSTAERVA